MSDLNLLNSPKKILSLLYQKLFLINDSAHKIALGIGLGVFSGILPGTGPLAAIFLAFIFRANRAAALIGSLLTNTWLSVITFILSIKIGSFILKTKWHIVQNEWLSLLQNFHYRNLFKLSILKIVFPVIVGYLALAFCCGLVSYLISMMILSKRRRIEKKVSSTLTG